jgi:uncharacterized membrane protein YgaE (UPF0421/DUF939 family)
MIVPFVFLMENKSVFHGIPAEVGDIFYNLETTTETAEAEDITDDKKNYQALLLYVNQSTLLLRNEKSYRIKTEISRQKCYALRAFF